MAYPYNRIPDSNKKSDIMHAIPWVNLKSILLSKKSRHKRPHVLYELSRKGPSTDQEAQEWLPVVGVGNMAKVTKGIGGPLWGDGNVLTLDYNDGCTAQ